MRKPLLIIVTGWPGAGKTTLARRLARELGLPLISKDDIKDSLFDSLGWQDREWSKKLGHASMEVLFNLLEVQLGGGLSVIAETAFIPQFHTDKFLELKRKYQVEAFQIHCTGDVRTLFERFKERCESGERHPGHVDHLTTYDQFEAALREGRYGILEIGDSLIEVVTTDYERVDYEGVRRAVELALGREEEYPGG